MCFFVSTIKKETKERHTTRQFCSKTTLSQHLSLLSFSIYTEHNRRKTPEI